MLKTYFKYSLVCFYSIFIFNCGNEKLLNIEEPTQSNCNDDTNYNILSTIDQSINSLKINNYFCFLDSVNGLALSSIDSSNLDNYVCRIIHPINYSIEINDTSIENGGCYNFGQVTMGKTYNLNVVIDDSNSFDYSLTFTTLPTVSIESFEEIVDDPKILSKIYINDLDKNTSYEIFAGIELRGQTSQTFPKLSYDLELWEDEEGFTTKKLELLDLRSDDDWHLDAMFVDLSRSRNLLGMEIWSTFSRSEHLFLEDDARLWQRGKLVELFLNNKYNGIYSLNEQIDRKQLQLNKTSGILYKTKSWSPEVMYLGIENEPDLSLLWNGFEIEFPDFVNLENWSPIYDLVNLVAYSNDSTFQQNIEDKLDIENSIDMWILLNAILANDNIGKNMYIFRYDETSKLSFAPWDLDLTFGNKNSIWTIDDPDDAILSNNLFDRLFELNVNQYKNKVKLRWNEIYANGLYENLILILNKNIRLIKESQAGERENNRWNISINYDDKLNYIENWLETRLSFFDSYVNDTF